MSVFVCGPDRLVRLQRDGRSWTSEPVLEGVQGQCVAADGARVLVGTRDRGAFLSADEGATWEPVELPEPGVFSVAISAADGALYAGTEPSRLFVARDGGRWVELEALQDIPSRDRWSFPPRPWTHHVRWIAPDPHRAERLLVGIELGGLMYSGDGGASRRSTPESCLTITCRTRSESIVGALTRSTIDFLSRPRSRNTR